MHPSIRLCSSSVRQPLIKFIGKRSWPSTPDVPHPHPAAPTELKQHFSDFLKKFESSAQPKESSTKRGTPVTAIYQEFWEAPSRFWKPRVRALEDKEIDVIMSGGAAA